MARVPNESGGARLNRVEYQAACIQDTGHRYRKRYKQADSALTKTVQWVHTTYARGLL